VPFLTLYYGDVFEFFEFKRHVDDFRRVAGTLASSSADRHFGYGKPRNQVSIADKTRHEKNRSLVEVTRIGLGMSRERTLRAKPSIAGVRLQPGSV